MRYCCNFGPRMSEGESEIDDANGSVSTPGETKGFPLGQVF
jgi:hypothetical protein